MGAVHPGAIVGCPDSCAFCDDFYGREARAAIAPYGLAPICPPPASKEITVSRISTRVDELEASLLATDESLEVTDNNVADLSDEVDEIKGRLDDLENDEDEDGNDLGAVVVALEDVQQGLVTLANVTAAVAVLANSGPYYSPGDDGFDTVLRTAAKRLLEQRVRYGSF